MSPLEAILILGLKPGRTYTASELEAALSEATRRELAAFRYPQGDLSRQDQSIEKLRLLTEAGRILRAQLKNGKLRIEAQKPAPGVSRSIASVSGLPQGIAATARRVAPSAATRGRSPSALTMLKTTLRALRDLSLVSWWLLTCPVRFLIEHKLVRSAVSFILVAILIWFSWKLLTGSIQALTSHVRAVCEAVNSFITQTFR